MSNAERQKSLVKSVLSFDRVAMSSDTIGLRTEPQLGLEQEVQQACCEPHIIEKAQASLWV